MQEYICSIHTYFHELMTHCHYIHISYLEWNHSIYWLKTWDNCKHLATNGCRYANVTRTAMSQHEGWRFHQADHGNNPWFVERKDIRPHNQFQAGSALCREREPGGPWILTRRETVGIPQDKNRRVIWCYRNRRTYGACDSWAIERPDSDHHELHDIHYGWLVLFKRIGGDGESEAEGCRVHQSNGCCYHHILSFTILAQHWNHYDLVCLAGFVQASSLHFMCSTLLPKQD